jgi:maleate isomerase
VISTTRIFLEQVTREAEIRMIEDDLPRALRLIKTTAPDIVVFGCTSAGSLNGIEFDAGIAKTIESQTGVRAVTIVASVASELRKIAAQRVAVFTPYREELTRTVAGCVREAGYTVAHAAGMGIVENLEIGRVEPAEIVKFVDSQMKSARSDADCLFLSCTNWQAIAALGDLRSRFGLPVISSNQAAIAACSMFHSGILNSIPRC